MRLGLGISIPQTGGLVAEAFSPLDLSPVLWLDASDTSTITESGGAVSQWDDKSGNGNDVAQGTAAAQPTTGTATLNGLNVIEFDGADTQHMLNATTVMIGTSYDWFMVLKVNASDTSYVLAQSANKNGTAGLTDSVSTSTARSSNFGTPSYYVDGVLHSGTTRKDLYDDIGTGVARVTRVSGAVQAVYDGVGVSRPDTTGRYSHGTVVGEIIVVPSSGLTAGDIADLETYLADKWGITL